MKVPGLWATQSFQFARAGASVGAATSLKSTAPSALVRITQRSDQWSASYFTPLARGSNTTGAAVGVEAGMKRVSLVSWSPMPTTMKRSSAVRDTPMNMPGSVSS